MMRRRMEKGFAWGRVSLAYEMTKSSECACAYRYVQWTSKFRL